MFTSHRMDCELCVLMVTLWSLPNSLTSCLMAKAICFPWFTNLCQWHIQLQAWRRCHLRPTHTRRGVVSGEAVLQRKPMGCRWSINSKEQVGIRCLINREHQLAPCIQHGCCLPICSQGTVWPGELYNDSHLWAMWNSKPVKAINGVELLLHVGEQSKRLSLSSASRRATKCVLFLKSGNFTNDSDLTGLWWGPSTEMCTRKTLCAGKWKALGKPDTPSSGSIASGSRIVLSES